METCKTLPPGNREYTILKCKGHINKKLLI